MSAVSPVLVLVTVNTRDTLVALSGGIMVPFAAMTLVLSELLMAMLYPAGTDGMVTLVPSFAGAVTEVMALATPLVAI